MSQKNWELDEETWMKSGGDTGLLPNVHSLPESSPALHLLQRVRDESHRFANTLHEGWRRRQIRESLLDELPGMGPRRKQLLLQTFGSLERLRAAAIEEIRAVEGFSGKRAEILQRFLRRKDAEPQV